MNVQTRCCNIYSSLNGADLFSSQIKHGSVRYSSASSRCVLTFANEAPQLYLSTFHCVTAKLAIPTLGCSVQANASCQTWVFPSVSPPPPLIFSAAVLAQIRDAEAIFCHAALKNPNFESQNCSKKVWQRTEWRGEKGPVENRFSPAGSPLQQTSKAEAAATSVAASTVSGSSIESLQSRKVRGRAEAPLSAPSPACRSHQRPRRSVTRHPPPEEETPAVFILKSHIGL